MSNGQFHVIHVAVSKHESFDDKRKAVEHYLPRNYTVDRSGHGYPEVVVVTGTDQAGWTALVAQVVAGQRRMTAIPVYDRAAPLKVHAVAPAHKTRRAAHIRRIERFHKIRQPARLLGRQHCRGTLLQHPLRVVQIKLHCSAH